MRRKELFSEKEYRKRRKEIHESVRRDKSVNCLPNDELYKKHKIKKLKIKNTEKVEGPERELSPDSEYVKGKYPIKNAPESIKSGVTIDGVEIRLNIEMSGDLEEIKYVPSKRKTGCFTYDKVEIERDKLKFVYIIPDKEDEKKDLDERIEKDKRRLKNMIEYRNRDIEEKNETIMGIIKEGD
jgi:hypothetical protein